MKPQPRAIYHDGKLYKEGGKCFVVAEDDHGGLVRIPLPYQPGDLLYVRETWVFRKFQNCYVDQKPRDTYRGQLGQFEYKADRSEKYGMEWCPSIHMPKEAARIFLRVTEVKVERLQDITEDQALAEGVEGVPCNPPNWFPCFDCMNTGWIEPPTLNFAGLWDGTIKPTDRDKYGWAANPWVWAIGFRRISRDEAQNEKS